MNDSKTNTTKEKTTPSLTPKDTPEKVAVKQKIPVKMTEVQDEDDLVIDLDEILGLHSPDVSDSDEKKVTVKNSAAKNTTAPRTELIKKKKYVAIDPPPTSRRPITPPRPTTPPIRKVQNYSTTARGGWERQTRNRDTGDTTRALERNILRDKRLLDEQANLLRKNERLFQQEKEKCERLEALVKEQAESANRVKITLQERKDISTGTVSRRINPHARAREKETGAHARHH